MLEIELAAKRSAQKRRSMLVAVACLGLLVLVLTIVDFSASNDPSESTDKGSSGAPEETSAEARPSSGVERFGDGILPDRLEAAPAPDRLPGESLDTYINEAKSELRSLAKIPTLASAAFALLNRLETEPRSKKLIAETNDALKSLRREASDALSSMQMDAMIAIRNYDAERAQQFVESIRRLRVASTQAGPRLEPTSLSRIRDILTSLEISLRNRDVTSLKRDVSFLEEIFPELGLELRDLEDELESEIVQSQIGELQQVLADSISEKDFSTAERALADLQLLGANEKSLTKFRILIDEKLGEILSRESLQIAEDAYANGNLSVALESVRKASIQDPSNSYAKSRLSQYESENALLLQANVFLERPERLSSKNVMAQAKSLLSVLATKESSFLAALAAKLKLVVADYTTTFTLVIYSDGASNIEIVGVGYIKPTRERRVELRRGSYTLVARCMGHQDKTAIVNYDTSVLPDAKVKVELGCGRKLTR